MKIRLRGSTYDGGDFEELHEFEYTFELFRILKAVRTKSDYFEVWLSKDVNAADAELVMGEATGGTWARGRCRGHGGTLTRLTANGGTA